MTSAPITGSGWSAEQRSIAQRVADYDWDGAMVPGCREISQLLTDDDTRRIGEAFWHHYLSLPATQHLRPYFTAERLARRIERSADYGRLKYGRPLDDEWKELAIGNA